LKSVRRSFEQYFMNPFSFNYIVCIKSNECTFSHRLTVISWNSFMKSDVLSSRFMTRWRKCIQMLNQYIQWTIPTCMRKLCFSLLVVTIENNWLKLEQLSRLRHIHIVGQSKENNGVYYLVSVFFYKWILRRFHHSLLNLFNL